MWLGGDPHDLRRQAADLRARVEALASDHAQVRDRLVTLAWEGTAAQAFRVRACADEAVVAHTLASVSEAAAALEHAADTVAARQQQLREYADALGRSVEDLWSEALSLGEDAVSYGARALEAAGHTALHVITGGLL